MTQPPVDADELIAMMYRVAEDDMRRRRAAEEGLLREISAMAAPPAADRPPAPGKRTQFTPAQKEALERWALAHAAHAMPAAQAREEVARAAGLSGAQVKVWLANWRARKRPRAE